MRVIIKEKEYDYTPDFTGGDWVFSKGDYFKKVFINGHTCFVKRFEVSRPENISGWKLMMNIKGKNKENLVRLYDIVQTTEKNRNVCYVFYEFIEGETLHSLILNNEAIDLRNITKDLFNAIRSLYENGYWFADFTEKNIFCSRTGKYVLIDIDSAQPLQLAPDNDMWGDKDYWVVVLNFYKNILREKNFRLADINGMSLNCLQLIFLILRIKLSGSSKKSYYFSSDLLNSLPAALDKQSSFFKPLFNKVLQKESFALQNDEITEIKNLVEDKIINAPVADIISPANNNNNENSSSFSEDERSNPVINEFNVAGYAEKQGDDYLIESGKPFTLKWKVKNALSIGLFKNDEFYKQFDVNDGDFTLKETYDGREKKIKFTLKASNNFSTVKRSLVVTVTDKIDENGIVDVYGGPVINEFKVLNYAERKGDVYLVENGKSFELTWDITNALKIELFKNNQSIKIFDPEEKTIELKEQIYDGIEKEIQYDIEASNRSIEIQRRSLTIKVIAGEDLAIHEFTVNNYIDNSSNIYTVESGKSFTLSWKLQNAQSVELYKNGQLYKSLSGNEGQIEIMEQAYDGRQKEINYTLKASANESETKSKSLMVVVGQPIGVKPEIIYFKSNKTVLRNGGYYTLSWDVRGAEVVELYKNDNLYKTFYSEKNIVLKENYEGKEKKIRYNLAATKNDVQTKSNNTVIVIVKPSLNIAKILLAVVLPIVVVVSSVLLYRSMSSGITTDTSNTTDSTTTVVLADSITSGHVSSDIVIDSFTKPEIAANTIIIITGKNIPQNDSSLKVTFNNIEGKIIGKTGDSIKVSVPALSSRTQTSDIVVRYAQTVFTAANNVAYTQITSVTAVSPYKAAGVYSENYITISGTNLPVTPGSVRVTFNDVEGVIKSQTKKSIYVLVPAIDNTTSVKIIVYVSGKQFIAANKIPYSNFKIVVDPISFNSVMANEIVTVTGKNLPANSWVQFNYVKGDIVSQTNSSIRVKVPVFTINVKRVDIGVCINGNKTPVRTANDVPYRLK